MPTRAISGLPSSATSFQPVRSTASVPALNNSIHSSLLDAPVPIHAISLIITRTGAAGGIGTAVAPTSGDGVGVPIAGVGSAGVGVTGQGVGDTIIGTGVTNTVTCAK